MIVYIKKIAYKLLVVNAVTTINYKILIRCIFIIISHITRYSLF